MERKFVLGLDIGIASVGWGIIELSTGIVVDKGVRIFPERTAAENAKRRQLRGARRLIRRRRQRIDDLRKILVENNIINDSFRPLEHPYEIRCEGLKRTLSNEELATALLHIAKRRGSFLEFDRIDKKDVVSLDDYYKIAAKTDLSGGVVEDSEEKAKENLATKAILDANSKLLKMHNIHVCELQLMRLRENGKIRANQNNFKVIEYLRELLAIFEKQTISEELKVSIIDIIFRKREYYDGPGSKKSPTPYGRYILKNGKITEYDLIEKMRGKCTLFPDEPRAPKMSYTADLFNFLNDLNNLNINGKKITTEQKKEIVEKFINEKGEISPEKLCSYLEVDPALVSGFRVKNYETPILTTFEGYKKLSKVVKNKNNPLPKEIIENKDYVDAVIDILTRKKGKNERIEELKKIDSAIFNDFVAEKLAGISGITQYHSLSLKAIKMMLPDLWNTNDNQMQIITKMNLLAGRKEIYKGQKDIPFDDKLILSPVAKRAMNEAIKIINAVRDRYGELDSIVIEMARERNSDEEKKSIKKLNKFFAELKEKARETIKGYNVELNAKLVNKIRFYNEQDCKCLYTGKAIDLELLLKDPKAYEIDHIIPISISLDDSMQNKVLVCADANRDKENMTPFKYFASGKATGWNYEEYKEYVINLHKRKAISKKKLQNLLFEEDITKYDVQKKFIQRNLVDTRYASRAILNVLQSYFKANDIKTKVFTVRGSFTNMFRKKANLQKNRDFFYHHIVDALIVASIKKLNYMDHLLNIGISKDNTAYDKETGEVLTVMNEKKFFPPDFINFLNKLRGINDATDYIKVNISHKVDRKPNRQFTDQTIYGVRIINDDYWRIGKIKDIYGDEGKKLVEDIKKGKTDRYLMKQNDPETFALLEKIVETTPVDKNENPFLKYKSEHGFIRKRSKKGEGPIVKSLKYKFDVISNYVDITHKYDVKNDKVKVVLLSVTTYRIDIYKSRVSGLYNFVTIRNHNIKSNNEGFYIDECFYNSEKARKGITDEFEFQFSLHKNEVVELTKDEPALLRFVGVNSERINRLEFKPLHCDRLVINEKEKRIRIDINKNVLNICKYNVDVLGNLYQVSQEELKLKF